MAQDAPPKDGSDAPPEGTVDPHRPGLNHPDPPLVFAVAIAAMICLAIVLPVRPDVSPWIRFAGAPPLIAGVVLHAWAWSAFRRAGTTVRADGHPARLVMGGPYARTRNPMYLGGILILLGLGFLIGAAAPLVVPVVYAAVAHTRFLPAEERVMKARFGRAYEGYRASVPTWI